MDKIDKLVEILERLNSGETPDAVREEAQAFLAEVDPTELSMAEQKLIQAGMAPEDLRHLCSMHSRPRPAAVPSCRPPPSGCLANKDK